VAGEIGHTVVEPGGKFCLCGGRGCLETVLGGDALVEQARTALGHRPSNPPKTLEELLQKARSGNMLARRVLAEGASSLGHAIGNVCNVLNPDIVVIGGAWGQSGVADVIIGPCLDGVRQTAMAAAYEEGFSLVPSRLPTAVSHGALVMGIHGTSYQ
jgi:predicted NBD/HSP70 family sugar kinase